ncbi:MAG: Ig-like domain-containing protein [Vicinamibacterales bacterium]
MRHVRRVTAGAVRRAAALCVAAAALAAAACDKVPLLAPTGSTITLTASSTIVPSGGSTQLTAFVNESSGTPVQNGTSVRFVTDIGTVAPAEAHTQNGMATATFNAGGGSGVATIRALSGAAANPATEGTNAVTITVGSAAVDTVTVRASPSVVPASGGTVSVTASVVGTGNRPLVSVPVTFSSTNGTLSVASAVTDADGHATVQLTTNRESVVTAAVSGKQGTVTVTVGATAGVSLTATGAAAGLPSSVVVTPTAGTSSRVILTWGDGSSSDLGLVSAVTTATHVYSNSGAYTITATATDGGQTFTTSTVVTVAARPSVTIAVASPAGGSGPAATTTFQFTVTPNAANGVRSVKVDFGDGSTALDLGAITTAASVTHKFTAGTYTVRATQTDNNNADTTAVVAVTATP